ncbi:YeeE/YedE family protein [Treponema sp.]|uniref:YeeE/YedE family protein n=1 Tax=Treponema sp. TaxID=166 RepID=UPI003FA265C3
MISGLVIGIIFGFFLKRGRFCPTGTIRDVRLEGYTYNLLLILALIATEGLLYHLMISAGLVPMPKLKGFPLISVITGSFIFGFGAILTNGCIVSTLVKTGDGRITGIISAITFMIGAAFAKQGALKPVTQALASKALVNDTLYQNIPAPAGIFAAIAIPLYIVMFRYYKTHKPKFSLPKQYSGLRHLLCEKIWSKEIIVVLCGILMAAGFYFSNRTGRNGGFGITTPLLSWFNVIANNNYSLNWASMLVVGIILGSFITAFISGEFTLVGTNAITVVKTMVGSIMMGIGAVWAQGCLIGNGLTGTAQLSVRAWTGLLFISLGIWTGTQLLLMRKDA